MVKITTVKQKYFIANVTEINVDSKLQELLEGIKDELKHKKHGDITITIFIDTKEMEICARFEHE